MTKNRHPQVLATSQTRVIRIAPLPTPQEMAQYDSTLPGSADRILKMAEAQSEHRQNLESLVVKSNVNQQRLGLIVGTVITIVAIICGTVLSLFDKSSVGLTVILSMLGIDAGVFVFGKFHQEKERAQKLSEAKN